MGHYRMISGKVKIGTTGCGNVRSLHLSEQYALWKMA